MFRMVLPVGLLCSAWGMTFALNSWAEPQPEDDRSAPVEITRRADSASAAEVKAEQERWEQTLKEKDKAQMLQIWQALMGYKESKGKLPDHLSDLVPEFLPDKAVLVSPMDSAHFRGANDPKLKTAYSYEFSEVPYGQGGLPFRSVKEAQMKEFGPVVPILRCFAHRKVVMNISYGGDYYESQLFWESSPGAQELMAKHGKGAGFEEGDFTDLHVVDGQTNAPLAGAEVRLTNRYYHDLALPDRTLTTDAEGHARVPLGPPPSRRLTVMVVKAGYVSPKQTWQERELPVEKTWPMAAAATVGGVVKDRGGTPLAGATVAVYAAMAETDAQPVTSQQIDDLLEQRALGGVPGDEGPELPMHLVERCKTDAGGQWRCGKLPMNFGRLRFVVDQEAAWRGEFRSGGDEQGAKIDRDALLGFEAEFKLEPAAVVAGVLRGPDGKPLADEEIWITEAGAGPLLLSRATTRRGAGARQIRLKTDESGRFSLKRRAPGELTLSAVPAGFAMLAQVVTPAPGMGEIVLQASPRRTIAGHVRDDSGHPVAGVAVTFIGWADVPAESQVAVTDQQGDFVWDSAPAGQIGLTFKGRSFTPSTEWVPAEKSEGVNVELRSLERE